jgi:hypothetical protein
MTMTSISRSAFGTAILLILSAPVAAQEDAQPARTQLDTGLRPTSPSSLQTNTIVTPANVTPMKRLETRLSNRIQSRINNRLEHVRGSRAKAPPQTRSQTGR